MDFLYWIIAALETLFSIKMIKVIISTLMGAFFYLIGWWDEIAKAFAVLIIIDFFFWLFVDLLYEDNHFSIQKFIAWWWIILWSLIAVITWNLFDIITWLTSVFKNILIVIISSHFALSILNNCVTIGVPIPPKVTKSIKAYRDSVDIYFKIPKLWK